MALSNTEILEELTLGNIIIDPLDESNIQTNSVDVRLGPYFYRERVPVFPIYNIWDKESTNNVWELQTAVKFVGKNMSGIFEGDEVIYLAPGERILGHTLEFIGGRKNLVTMLKTRSSMNRASISICLCAGWGDSEFFNRWTLEITNHSRFYTIPLVVGRRVGQIVFFRSGEVNGGYNGKYQESHDIEHLKKNWTPAQMLPKLYLDREITNGGLNDSPEEEIDDLTLGCDTLNLGVGSSLCNSSDERSSLILDSSPAFSNDISRTIFSTLSTETRSVVTSPDRGSPTNQSLSMKSTVKLDTQL